MTAELTMVESANARLATMITERQWQTTVQQLLSTFGFTWYHAPDNRPNARGRVQHVSPGFPDLIAVRGPRLLAVELKTVKGRVTPEQRDWLNRFTAAGAESYLWRPTDTDLICSILARDRQS